MNNLFIAATASSPEVDFRFDEHRLSLKGEAYPEHAAAFWGDIIAALRDYLERRDAAQPITVQVSLAYFNSSSTKMLFALFGALNEKARAGTPVTLDWFHDADDDTMFEFGQELHEDFPALTFRSQVIEE